MSGLTLVEILDEIQRKFNVEYERKIEDILSQSRESYIYVINGTKNEEFVTFIVYDCLREGKFDFQKFFRTFDSINEVSIEIVMIFDDWMHEYKLYEECYKEQTKDNKEKIRLTGIFEQKNSYYAKSSEPVQLMLQNEGINYLEYDVDGTDVILGNLDETEMDEDKNFADIDSYEKFFIKGRVYNLQMSEIQKLYYVTGKDLFIKNVRLGIEEKNIVAKKIKDSFKSYFQVYCYQKISDRKQKRIAKGIWKLTTEIIQENSPQKFWYYHNGITFFVEKNDEDSDFIFETMGSVITVNPKKVSVINGAQTLTNIFYGIQEVLEELNELIDNVDESLTADEKNDTKELFSSWINKSLHEIYVKAIFIEAKSTLSDSITKGLNTQIPILEEDSLASSKDIMTINEALYERNIKVLKVGEKEGTKRGLSVLDLCKLFLTTKENPGKSKNFPKNEMQNVLDEILKEIEGGGRANFLNSIETVLNISDWWPSRKNFVNSSNEKEKIIEKYGRNYFQSYFLIASNGCDSINDEMIIQTYTKFLSEFSKFEVSLGEFKKNQLFESFKQTRNTEMQDFNLSHLSDLKDYLNEIISKDSKQKRSINHLITNYFINQQINLDAFRTIPLIKEATGKYSVKEAFSFSSKTFNSLYQGKDYLNIVEDIHYPEFEDSIFGKAVSESFPLFSIYWSDDNLTIDKITYYKAFSFEKFSEEAKIAYNQTVRGFQEGDYNLFPKVSDDLKFHIRPKAINADDQFMFSNGEFITKRTFWANRETVYQVMGVLSSQNATLQVEVG